MPASGAPQQYLAFVFSEAGVVAALWQKLEEKVRLISRSSVIIPLEGSELSDSVDIALDELGEDTLNIKQVLFAVPANWIESGDLTTAKKAFLKKLSQDLQLDPMGFVTIEDSLLAWQAEQLGKEFTGTLITATAKEWQMALVKDGQITQSEAIGRSQEPQSDWQELSARLEALGKDHHRALYIDLMPAEDEYGQVVVKLRHLLKVPVEKIRADQLSEIAVAQGGTEILRTTSKDSDHQIPKEAAALVFDNLKIPEDVPTEESNFRTPSFLQSTTELTEPETMAIETGPQIRESDPNMGNDEETAVIGELATAGEPNQKPSTKFRFPKLSLPFAIPKKLHPKLILPLGILIVLLLLGGAGAFFLSTKTIAQVNITLQSKDLQVDTQVPLADGNIPATLSAQLASNSLTIDPITDSVTVSEEVPTTGNRIVGDPAKGKVMLYNKTGDTKTFPAGTKLAFDKKTFMLDDPVTIASASAKEGTTSRTIEFGSVSVNITTAAIGPDGNIAKDSHLTVANFSSNTFEAIVSDNLAGGTSHEAQAVAQTDINKAVADLKTQALSQLKDKFSGQSDDSTLVLFSPAGKAASPKTSAKVGEEANTVKVEITFEGKAYKLSKTQVTELAKTLFKDQLPENFTLQESSLTLDASSINDVAGIPVATVTVKAKGVPVFDPKQVQQSIAGQYAGRAQTVLGQTPGITQATVVITPKQLAPVFGNVPKDTSRIKMNIKNE